MTKVYHIFSFDSSVAFKILKIYHNPMTLREYIFYSETTVKDFAEKIGYSRTHVSAVISGKRSASEKLKRLVKKHTENTVTFS